MTRGTVHHPRRADPAASRPRDQKRTVNLAAGGRIDTARTWGADFTAQFNANWKANAGLRLSERDYVNDAYPLNPATLRQIDARDPRSW